MILHKAFAKGNRVLVVAANNCSMEINCSAEQYKQGVRAYASGKLIQDAFPFLSAGEREFLISGITPDRWNSIFGTVEE